MLSAADISFVHLGIEIEQLKSSISVFGFTIAFYGIIIGIGIIAGIVMAERDAVRSGQNPEIYLDFAIYGIIFSIIGARLYYVVFAWDSYKNNLLQIFNIRGGGLAIYGGVIAGVLTLYIFCRVKRQHFFRMADSACIGLITGQIIGRWGNFFNSEAFGGYTDNLFAMRIKRSLVNESMISKELLEHLIFVDGVEYIQVHPTFLYESAWNLGVLIFMLWYRKRKTFDGEMLCLYLLGYGLGRLWIEGLRTDQLILFSTGIPVSQVLSGVLVLASAGIIILQYTKRNKSKKTEERY